MLKRFSFIALFAAAGFIASGQTVFLENVKVEYEKVVYVRQMIRELWGQESFDRWGSGLPQSTKYYYDFVGNTEKSVYKPGRQGEVERGWWSDFFNNKNIVQTDYKNKKLNALKPVFEENFLVEDSLLNIKWKFTADTRNIAGFECRKAIGILNDSIAIFAFYTDEILVNGGPESIQGLPGLILGMGVPRLHSTWFATKVEVNASPINAPAPPRRTKKVTNRTMVDEIYQTLKNWGSEGGKMIVNFMI